VVLHLAQTEELVVASVKGDLAPFARDRGRGGSVDEFAARWVEDERSTPPDAVYQRWRTARHAALDALRGCPPGTRLLWATSPTVIRRPGHHPALRALGPRAGHHRAAGDRLPRQGHWPVPLLLKPVPSRASMPASKSDLASRASMVTGLSCLAAASTFGIEPPQLADRRLILLDGSALGRGKPRLGVPSVGLVVEHREIAGLVLVHADDPGHSGVVEPAGLGQGRLQQGGLSGGDLDTLAEVPGEPANLADGVPVLLTLAAHPAERRTRGPGARRDLRSPVRPRSGFPAAVPAVIVGAPPRQPGIVVEVLCGADTDGDLIAVAPGGRRN